ncbi:MAG: hypothetical protein NAOJABEB_00452 [Steroidobacteraceae bacterium]|nr:hypothetical protein [Steroidobacteraceae bacterium]
MLIRHKPPRELGLNEPLRHPDHAAPVTRRELISRGFQSGAAVVTVPSVLGLLAPRAARAALSPDIEALKQACGITDGAGKIPFIAFDLAGGANMSGSEVLIGGPGGQLDFLSTAGYGKLGLPGDMVPNSTGPTTFVDTSLGLAWHSDGGMLRGILSKASLTAQANTNGAVIAARSENDTANNPHNPMYGIQRCGADGQLLTLIGSRASDSGGNSMAPMPYDLAYRPTKVDRTSDVTGLVDTGKLAELMAQNDAVAVLESMVRLSGDKLNRVDSGVSRDAAIKTMIECGYTKTAYLADRFGQPANLNPELDTRIKGAAGIFTDAEFDSDGEFEKTAAVMKMVIEGYAGAGTITMGGYDYHGQGRATGEVRNFRAGQCIGACLEFAHRAGKPLMIYVFSDGSLSSGNQVDNTANGRGKFMWTSDNQSTASSFFLVYNPRGRPVVTPSGSSVRTGNQIGYYTDDGSVANNSNPAANAVNLLVNTVLLNYLALHQQIGQFSTIFPGNGLGSGAQLDSLAVFAPIVDAVITNPL